MPSDIDNRDSRSADSESNKTQGGPAMKPMLDPIPDNYRFYVGEAAKAIGMPRRTFNEHLRKGNVKFVVPSANPNKKIIYGKELKRFYYSLMGFDLPE